VKYRTWLNHRVPSPPPPPLRVAKAGRNHLNEEFTPSSPLGYSQTITNLGHAALLRWCELPLNRKCWTNSGGSLINSLFWGLNIKIPEWCLSLLRPLLRHPACPSFLLIQSYICCTKYQYCGSGRIGPESDLSHFFSPHPKTRTKKLLHVSLIV
jgi:hypothetical protein